MSISWSGLGEAEIIGKNRLEDVRWLASLTDSELDSLISLKQLVIQRAKIVGQEHIAEKFDLKMLRILGFVMMKYFKERLKDSPVILDLAESSASLKDCNQSNLERKGGFDSSTEDVLHLIGSDSRKRMAEGSCERLSRQKKQRSE